MRRKIATKMSVTEKIKIIQGMMNNMNSVDRQIMSDKLLSFLLFESDQNTDNKTVNTEIKKAIDHVGLSEEELKLIKELGKRTEDLWNLLGDHPDLFT